MKNAIRSVQLVSDGILLELHNGTARYIPSNFLLGDTAAGKDHLFVNYDASAILEEKDNNQSSSDHNMADLGSSKLIN